MRYAPAENLLRLARHLAATRVGLTLDEMASELGVVRRTAERLRDALQALCPELAYRDDEARVRRWYLPGSALTDMPAPTVEVVASVETAAREFAHRGEAERAGLLREAAAVLRAGMRPAALTRAEPDIAALMEAEGTAMRPGPRPVMARNTLSVLRRAILGMQMVSTRYRAAGEAESATRRLCPYGILYGGRGWLVAHQEGKSEMRLWRLDRLETVTLLDDGFARREDFDLSAYAAQSFGVYQEDPLDVVLSFAPSAADDAAHWCFHPTQTLERQTDGSLVVRFRAGGMQEICHHLLSWGDTVTILKPARLVNHMAQATTMLAKKHVSPRLENTQNDRCQLETIHDNLLKKSR